MSNEPKQVPTVQDLKDGFVDPECRIGKLLSEFVMYEFVLRGWRTVDLSEERWGFRYQVSSPTGTVMEVYGDIVEFHVGQTKPGNRHYEYVWHMTRYFQETSLYYLDRVESSHEARQQWADGGGFVYCQLDQWIETLFYYIKEGKMISGWRSGEKLDSDGNPAVQ
jgi:hypothetical protein